MDRFFRINHILLGCVMIGTIGCGGSEPASTSSPANSQVVSGDGSQSVSTTASTPATSSTPAKELKGGMMLPDEVPLGGSAEIPAQPDPNSTKGMQLPDELSP